MPRSLTPRILALALLLLAPAAGAVGPHEVLLLVNRNAPSSLTVANHYAHLRHIPDRNILYLSIPEHVMGFQAQMGMEQFNQLVRLPAEAALQERGIAGQVAAWVYSSDFPVRILTDSTQPLSLAGATLLKGQVPEAQTVAQGTYLSPLFRGPDHPDGNMAATGTFDAYASAFGDKMPVPSMMLGFTGTRGLLVEEVEELLRRGVASDATHPRATVHFETNANIRSVCRAWQFPIARAHLAGGPISAEIGGHPPAPLQGVVGYMTGAATVRPAECVGSFVPGAMAGHLTSHAATFHSRSQTKLTEWLRAGATASAGTVTEPRALWAKFPSALFYLHYGRGCSVIESFYQSIRCPLQVLLVGEPLAAPYRLPLSVSLVALEDGTIGDKITFVADVSLPPIALEPSVAYLLDGLLLGKVAGKKMFSLDTAKLADGYHEMRAVARAGFPLVNQAHAIHGFTVSNRGRSVALTGAAEHAEVDGGHVLSLEIRSGEGTVRAGLACRGREITAKDVDIASEGIRFQLRPQILGFGPVELKAFALYPDGEQVWSAPLPLTVARLNRSPQIEPVRVEPGADGGLTVTAEAADPDGDPVHYAWFRPLPTDVDRGRYRLSSGTVFSQPDHLAFASTGTTSTCVLEDSGEGGTVFAAEVACGLGGPPELERENVGLVFGARGPDDYCFFGVWGDVSCWMLRTYRNGKVKQSLARGAYIRRDRWYALSIEITPDGTLVGRVDGDPVCRLKPSTEVWDGNVGFLTGFGESRFRNPMIGLPAGRSPVLRFDSESVRPGTLVLRVDDGQCHSELKVALPQAAGTGVTRGRAVR